MNCPKISVVIPIYGVEKYIERCARSLFEQTLDDIEYIFVDDCTKDLSISILESVIDDYPDRKKQITILHHEENKGLPQARKTGIMEARGEYIAHCDSDDWVEKEMYERLYIKAKDDDADIVFCDYYKTDGVNKKYINGICKSTEKYAIINDMVNGVIDHATWMYIAKRNLYLSNPIVYPNGFMGEDYSLTLQLVYYSRGFISYDHVALYNYWKKFDTNDYSTDIETIQKHYSQKIENYNAILRLLIEAVESIKTRTLIALIPRPKNKELNKVWASMNCDVSWYNILFDSHIPFKNKCKYFAHCAGLF
jgi:glycosyltransferase involved in cell wall biosynthesis